MARPAFGIVLTVLVTFLVACQCFQDHSAQPTDTAATVRNQGYALLYATVDDESGVDKVLIIKDPKSQVVDLLKQIARFCGGAKAKLQAFAKEDPTLALHNEGLPKMETKTRASISGSTAKQIILSGGKKFEFRILLTQHEALNYIGHLAGTLSAQDTHEDRKHYFAQLAKDAKALDERVIALLEAPYVGQVKS